MGATMDSLKRLGERLKGHTPEARFLWDRQYRPRLKEAYTPVEETVFCDYVKRHLQDDLVARGVIVNREVEIRASRGSGTGARTDILVDAVARHADGPGSGRLRVVIEAKGSWHKELFTAMRTQLKASYFRRGSCSHGIYLVGWFRSSAWLPGDRRRLQHSSVKLPDARSRLTKEASQLSTGATRIAVVVLDASLPAGKRRQRHP
jgi:hypothetical protein